MVQAKNLHNPSYIIQATEQSGRAVQCTLARGCTRYHSSLKIKENDFVFLVLMEYVPDVELFCDPLTGPNVPSGDLKQLAQSSTAEGLGPALAACARVGFPGYASK